MIQEPTPSLSWKGEQTALLSWAANRTCHRADHLKRAIFSGVLHWVGGRGSSCGQTSWITCAQYVCIADAAPKPLSSELHLTMTRPPLRGLSSAPRLTGSPSPSDCIETLALLRYHTNPLPEPYGVAMEANFFHVMGQAVRLAVTEG